MPFVTVNGLTMHFQHHLPGTATSSSRPPVLLLAGMASDSNSWQPVVASLRKYHELIIPDNRCTGRTQPNPITTTRAAMVTDTLGLMSALEIDKFSIVGHSMGGMLAWAIASATPDRVTHLISASALPTVLPARIALFDSLSALRNESTETQWFSLLFQFLFRPDFFNDPLSVEAAAAASQAYPYRQTAEAFATQSAGLRSFLPMPDINAITCPITMLTGSHDVLMTPEMLRQFVSDKPHIHSQIIDQAAHALHWEQTEQVSQCLLEALRVSG